MVRNKQEIFRLLRKIRETVRASGPADPPESLNSICTSLEEVVHSIPEAMSDLFKLIRLCVKGVYAISDATVSDSSEILEAVANALEAAENYLADHPRKGHLVREAGQLLDNLLPPATEARKGLIASVSPEDLATVLNDAAALLIQIEPDDFDDMARLKDLLDSVSADDRCPDACRQPIARSARKISEMTDAGPSGPQPDEWETVSADIGQQIREALTAVAPDEAPVRDEIRSDGMPPGDGEDTEADYMPDEADLELIGEFITECSDLITSAEDSLLALEEDPDDIEAVSTVFRAFHNIKGTSAFFELSLMTELAHHAESVLSRIRDKEIRYAGGYPDLALRSVDMLKELFRLLQEALGGAPFSKPDGYDDLVRLLKDPEETGISDKSPLSGPALVSEPAETDSEAEVPGPAEATEINSEIPQAPPVPAQMPEALAVPSGQIWEDLPETDEKKVSEAPPKTAPQAPRQQVVESSIRVPINRLDRFIDMVGELVVAHSMVAQDEMVAGGAHHDLIKKVAHTGKIVRELQSMSMSMRMIPLKTTFRKMARLVRDLSRKVGKDVRFISEGEDTEIDRNMVDIINDPLVHMVRNALDHGIELPEIREKLGKPRYGTVWLSAYHSAGNVVVEVRDDGRGLDREAILGKAAERGLITDGSGLSDREVCNLIFEPGFSTAQVVSDVSGRGVGMDVVKRNIEAIRGHVEIQADPGKGSTFKMSLPLTLAIIDGMVVRVGREKYVIPTISIVRSVQPTREDLSTVLHQGEVLNLQGNLIPLFRLAELFGINDAEQDLTRAIAVVVENDGHQAGLLVDELIGSQQIVIKTLGETLGNITGISGSAIMPDGRVGLILDVGGLVRLTNRI